MKTLLMLILINLATFAFALIGLAVIQGFDSVAPWWIIIWGTVTTVTIIGAIIFVSTRD